jgi:hypothetical protein
MKGSTGWRHFKALNKKNYINWRRSLCGGLFEIFCPIALFLVLMLLRQRIKVEYIRADDLSQLNHAIYTAAD